MNNINKLKINTITGLLNRFVIMISGLIIPRLILVYYGSNVNGMVSSITQFLSIITFLDLGVGTVVQSGLYKPLVENDEITISKILKSAKLYFRRISYILIVYIFILVAFYPRIVNIPNNNFMSTAFLIIAISIRQFSQYYFGIINEFLLNADQKSYIQLGTEILVVILNLVISIILITHGTPIHLVKLIAGLIYLIRPFLLNEYVKKNYNLNLDIDISEDPLPQKWHGMGQHIAHSIQNSTDITVLTIFSTLSNVSVYSVYNLITSAIKLIVSSFTTGLQSFFGNLLATDKVEMLNNYFTKIEWGLHTLVTFLYSMTAVLITPFVLIYTQGVDDANYYQPLFAILLVLSRAIFSLRTPYQALVFSAGHFKQTQWSSYIEAAINVLVSVILVQSLGISGVALGSLLSMIYRTFYLTWYLSINIVHRSMNIFVKQIIVDGISFCAIFGIGSMLRLYLDVTGILEWLTFALIVGLCSTLIIFFINFIFYRKLLFFGVKMILKR